MTNLLPILFQISSETALGFLKRIGPANASILAQRFATTTAMVRKMMADDIAAGLIVGEKIPGEQGIVWRAHAKTALEVVQWSGNRPLWTCEIARMLNQDVTTTRAELQALQRQNIVIGIHGRADLDPDHGYDWNWMVGSVGNP